MKKIVFTPDNEKRWQLLQNQLLSSSSYKTRMFFVRFLFVLAALILLGAIVAAVVMDGGIEGAVVAVGLAVIVAIIPFLSARAIKLKASYRATAPFSGMGNGTLVLEEDALTFYYWNIVFDEPAAKGKKVIYEEDDKITYTINKSDITDISVAGDVCTVKGKGKLDRPFWLCSDPMGQSDKVIDCNELRFLVAFKENDFSNTIMNWRDDR